MPKNFRESFENFDNQIQLQCQKLGKNIYRSGVQVTTVKCRYNAVLGVQEIDRVIAVTAL